MRRCSKQSASILLGCALLFAGGLGSARPAHGQASQASASTSTAEQQPSLEVERDPVRSPDEADNAAVKPGSLTDAAANGKPSDEVGKSGEGRFTLRRDVQEVVLNATVLDDQGHLVNDLTRDDFHVLEDGVAQTVASFQHSDTPVSLGILVDSSGSMRSKRGAVNAAALDLIRSSNPQDEAFIVNFSDEAFIDQDFTSDLNKLRDGLAHSDAKGGTALYDATVASADELSKGAKRPKQVILIITDGEDNASGLTLEQTIRRVQELQGPIVYCIGLLFGEDSGGRESRQAKRALQLLAQETGGIAYFPRNLNEVDAIADEVAKDIRSQYTIGYHATRPASLGGYRQVKVLAHAAGQKRALNVRTRSGYYPRVSTATTTEAGNREAGTGQQ